MSHRRSGRLVTAVIATVFGLAGCGSAAPSGASPTAAIRSGASPTTASPSAVALSGTVTVWDASYGSRPEWTEAFDQINAQFEAMHPNVKVVPVPQSMAVLAFEQALAAAFAAKQGPDVFWAIAPGRQGLGRYIEGLEDLTDRVTPEMKSRLTHWEAATSDFNAGIYAPEGVLYAVPTGTVNFVMYYNKPLFSKAGLDPNNLPTTYSEILDACKSLLAAGITPIASGNNEGIENDWYFATLYPGIGTQQDLEDLGSGRTPFDNPVVRETLETYAGLQNAGCFDKDRFSKATFPDAVDSFANGEGAMFLGLGTAPASYAEFVPAIGEDNLGASLGIGIRAERPNFLAAAPFKLWCIPSFSPNKEAAWAYVEFITSSSSHQKLFDDVHMLPNDLTVQVPADAPAHLHQILQGLRDEPTFIMPHEVFPGKNMLNEMRRGLSEYLQGRMTLDQLITAVQNEAGT